MNKVAVVYWSGTGNTAQMARSIQEGVSAAGGEVSLLTSDDFTGAQLNDYNVVAFGCPSMGDEVLEEESFEPMFTGLENQLKGRKIALFGSYGWGDGQWMRDWVERCQNQGAQLFDGQGLMLHETPDDAGKAACTALGKQLAAW